MKKIIVEYEMIVEQDFITWLCANEEDYIDELWDLIESHSLEEFIEE